MEIHTLYVIRCKSVSLTLKQAKRTSMRYRKVTKRASLSSLKPVHTDATLLANNSQYWWMLHVASVCTPCCMLLGVLASACTPLPTRTQQLLTLLAQQCRELLRQRAKQSRTTTQSSSAFNIQDGDYSRENSSEQLYCC